MNAVLAVGAAWTAAALIWTAVLRRRTQLGIRATFWYLWFKAAWWWSKKRGRCQHPGWFGPVGGPCYCVHCGAAEDG